MTIDWQNEIVHAVKERLEDRRSRGIPKASLRGIFYALVSLEMIPNTQGAYKTLSRALVTARRNGVIPNDWIVDETRKIVDIKDNYATPAYKIDTYIYTLLDWLPDAFKDELIPRWRNQPNYVEVWIEKNAMRGVFISIIDAENRQVRIVPNGGWSSYSFYEENKKRLFDKKLDAKEVYVLYYGDYDPSGLRMVERLRDELEALGIHFVHVAITKKQIRKYHLEHLKNVDPQVTDKLLNDSNSEWFRSINEDKLFQIEVDALDALSPDDLKSLLLDTVDDYFDSNTYDQLLDEPDHQPENIRRLVHDKLKKRLTE
jgi:hypothetical protein